jgi:hypothetical protein
MLDLLGIGLEQRLGLHELAHRPVVRLRMLPLIRICFSAYA